MSRWSSGLGVAPAEQAASCPLPDLGQLSISEPGAAGPAFPQAASSLGPAYPALPDFGLGAAAAFGPPGGTSDLRPQTGTGSSFDPGRDAGGGLRDFGALAAAAGPQPLEDAMGEPQEQQALRYDLLSSVPRE